MIDITTYHQHIGIYVHPSRKKICKNQYQGGLSVSKMLDNVLFIKYFRKYNSGKKKMYFNTTIKFTY